MPRTSKKPGFRAAAENTGSASAGDLRALVRRLIDQQEAERLWVARELHDILGQSCTLLKLMLDTARRGDGEDLANVINEAEAVVDEATARVRRVSRNMRPSMLDLSLKQALMWLFEVYASDPGLRVIFKTRGLKDDLPQELNTAVYRIVQEALDNVAGHAGVKEAEVGVTVRGGELRLEIKDAGRGCDAALMGGGILFMKERAAMAGGKLDIKSHSGGGTVVVAVFPILQGQQSAPRPLC